MTQLSAPMRVRHIAECPEVSPPLCEELGDAVEEELPAHWHEQGIVWFRLEPTINAGLGKGWQAHVSVPVDLRDLSIEYTDVDGNPFDPPYGNIHHRNEVLAGLADGKMDIQRLTRSGSWTLGVSLGTSLPLGRIEEDPYALAALGLEHQHFQLGNGTFVPRAGTLAIRDGAPWGFLATAEGWWALYANSEGYTPSSGTLVAAGPTLDAGKNGQLMALGEVAYDAQDHWDGELNPQSGRLAARAGVGGLWPLGTGVVLQAQVRTTVAQMDLAEAQFRQPLIATVGLSWEPR
ncbi:MAG: hypothetical protein QGG40_15275 [Myxococcota bacterium]|nr:hypothetical protein [Myxococcota bacterium]